MDAEKRKRKHRMLQGASVAIVLLGVLFTGCSSEDPPLQIDLSIREKVVVRPEDEATLTYAYLPQYSHSVSYQRHHLIVEYIKKRTGMNIKQVFPDTFDEHMRMVRQGKIDISFSNPFVYIALAETGSVEAFARVVEVYGDARFRGVIISRADNQKIRKLEDCIGKKWIAVDPGSAGGYLYPLGHFIDNGIRPEDFAEIAFAPGPGGKQEKVVLAVHAGRYDIGSIREGTLGLLAEKIDIGTIRVLARTGWYPGWVYFARRHLDPGIVARIKTALTELDYDQPEGRKILDRAQIRDIIPSGDADFNPVRALREKVGNGSSYGCCVDQ